MGNVEIISIVFGFSALIMILLIFVFRWLGIRSDNCCFTKKNLYMIDVLNKPKRDKNNSVRKSDLDFNSIWNSQRSLSIMSSNTMDTMLYLENDANVNMQLIPNLKPMTPCHNERLNDDSSLNKEFITNKNHGFLEIELNYNPYV